jgi:hypothetical protein
MAVCEWTQLESFRSRDIYSPRRVKRSFKEMRSDILSIINVSYLGKNSGAHIFLHICELFEDQSGGVHNS